MDENRVAELWNKAVAEVGDATYPTIIARFAALVTEDEREACAKVCRRRAKAMQETIRTANPRTSEHIMLRRDARLEEANDCAAEIMERSNAELRGRPLADGPA